MELFSYPDNYQFKHPLEHTWTLWYLDSNRTKNWEDCLMEVGSFGTVEDFWCLFHHIKRASELKPGCDYSLFKKGITPMWEDKANKDGGRWIINLEKRITHAKLDHYWLEIAMCLIGECFHGLNDKINGATINIRTKQNKIGLWTNTEDRSTVVRIGMKVKELMGIAPSQVIHFQIHKDCQEKKPTEQLNKLNTYYV
uniref:eIF-4F 25 kDa subunit n=2 Tax=Triatominae TaxID=70999 RepID=A0A224XL18_9HEMI